MTGYDVADELLIPAVHAATTPIVTAAREIYGRPLPRLRSAEFLDAPRIMQQAVLVICGSSLVLGPYERALLRDAQRDVHGALTPAEWRRSAHSAPFDELQRRRRVERGPDGQWRATRGAA